MNVRVELDTEELIAVILLHARCQSVRIRLLTDRDSDDGATVSRASSNRTTPSGAC
jgi:hypothetical protein